MISIAFIDIIKNSLLQPRDVAFVIYFIYISRNGDIGDDVDNRACAASRAIGRLLKSIDNA